MTDTTKKRSEALRDEVIANMAGNNNGVERLLASLVEKRLDETIMNAFVDGAAKLNLKPVDIMEAMAQMFAALQVSNVMASAKDDAVSRHGAMTAAIQMAINMLVAKGETALMFALAAGSVGEKPGDFVYNVMMKARDKRKAEAN
jgi:hypothetical protein